MSNIIYKDLSLSSSDDLLREITHDVIETFKTNHKKSLGISEDIRKISIKEFKKKINNKKIHIICGGPPCQGFSTIGPGDAEDSRNHLFLQFVRFVKELKPEIIELSSLLNRDLTFWCKN